MASQFEATGRSIQSVGKKIQGTFLQTAATTAKIGTGLAALGSGLVLGGLIKSSVKFNEEMETSQGIIASTLQLYDFFDDAKFDSGMDKQAKLAAQFQMNLSLAQGEMDKIFSIAAKSPASFEQGREFYQMMLPGAASITRDMDRIREMFRKGLTLGTITGDYKVAGQQTSRILKGGAGAEFDVWKTMEKPIMKAGKEMGLFKKNVREGADITKKFNELSGADRLRVFEAATEGLGVATDYWATTWVGLVSTLQSSGQLLKRDFGRAMFDTIKQRMKLLAEMFSPDGSRFKNLQKMAATWGVLLAGPLSNLLEWGTQKLVYITNNWQDISIKLLRAWEAGKNVAGLMLKAAILRTGVGVTAQAGGMAIQAGSGIFQVIKSLVSMGPVAAAAAIAVSAIAAAFAVIGGGVFAHFISKWDEIVQGFRDGSISIAPLLQVVSDLWAKFLALGAAMTGNASGASMAGSIISLLTDFIYGLTKTIEWTIRIGALMVFLIEQIITNVQMLVGAIATAMTSMLLGILKLAEAITGQITGTHYLVGEKAGQRIEDSAIGKATAFMESIQEGAIDMTKNGAGGFGDSALARSMFEGADAFRDAAGTLSGEDWEAQWRSALAQAEEDAARRASQGPPGDPSNDMTNNPKGGNTHIYKMTVTNDLRNNDPDRIIGAFLKSVNKAIDKRTGATTGVAGAK
jgi:hypothetical protein